MSAVLALCLSGGLGWAQPAITVENFRVNPEHYPAPNQRQPKSLLEGLRAQPLPGGRVLVTEAKLQTFRVDGTVEMVVVANECEYHQALRTVSSPGPLTVKTADGGFAIQGQGFLWRQTNSSLVISNRVVTDIQPDLLQARQDKQPEDVPRGSGPAQVMADRFEYGADTGLGAYLGNVRVISTNLLLTSKQLRFKLPLEEKRIREISALENVVLDYAAVPDNVHATGDQAIYKVESGLLTVVGKPQWTAGARQGSADQIVVDRSNHVFAATGNAYLKMPAQSAKGLGLLGVLQTNNAAVGEHFVEVRSDSYEIRTNQARFERQVRVLETSAGKQRGNMSCRTMLLEFVNGTQVSRLEAVGDFQFEQDDKSLRGGKAVYQGTTGELEVTINPDWRAGERQGHGEIVRLDTTRNEMFVSGQAWMRLPAGDLGQGIAGPVGAKSAESPLQDGPAYAEVFCRQYRLGQESMRFTGAVRIVHPRMRWQCELVRVEIPADPRKSRKVIAEPAVIFELQDQKGQTIHGTGDRAILTQLATPQATNLMVELTGVPAMLETTNGVSVKNRVLMLDLASSKFIVPPGGYRIAGPASMVNTNVYLKPKLRWFR